MASLSFTGKLLLYNLTADPAETRDLASARPETARELASKLLSYAKEAAMIPPLSDEAPWQGDDYYCARCTPGRPQSHGLQKPQSWDPWCKGKAGTTC